MTTEFNYSGLTLDELRSLAASPQVGAMEAMPQAFRTLADKVGEVAELLTRAQSDLPNWWKGTAAEQAAAALGRAAAEAREFHDSAMGAATAVSRCASVVAEQQHQMMNVPELPEPGVTDTIVRPATPMDALEAARKDAAYRAAHEQAVQVINGIAAQYVETREYLATIGSLRGESFDAISEAHQPYPSGKVGMSGSGLGTTFGSHHYIDSAHPLPLAHMSSGEAATELQKVSGATESFDRAQRSSFPLLDEPHPDSSRSGDYYMTPVPLHDYRPQRVINVPPPISQTSDREKRDTMTLTSPKRSSTHPADDSHDTHMEAEASGQWAAEPAKEVEDHRYPRERLGAVSGSRPSAHSTEGSAPGSHPRNLEPSEPAMELADNIAPMAPQDIERRSHPYSSSEEPPFIPPFTGGTTARYHRDDRRPRPTYLEERKSTWVTDVIAAPPDGIITSDWLEQQ